jgi:hypothetical protein
VGTSREARIKSWVREHDKLDTKVRSGKITKTELRRKHKLMNMIAENQGFTKYQR